MSVTIQKDGVLKPVTMVENARAQTRSCNPTARVFCFLYSCLMFDTLGYGKYHVSTHVGRSPSWNLGG